MGKKDRFTKFSLNILRTGSDFNPPPGSDKDPGHLKSITPDGLRKLSDVMRGCLGYSPLIVIADDIRDELVRPIRRCLEYGDSCIQVNRGTQRMGVGLPLSHEDPEDRRYLRALTADMLVIGANSGAELQKRLAEYGSNYALALVIDAPINPLELPRIEVGQPYWLYYIDESQRLG